MTAFTSRRPRTRSRAVALLVLLAAIMAELAVEPGVGAVALADDCPYPRRLVRRPRHRQPRPVYRHQEPDDRVRFVNLKFGAFNQDGRPEAGGFFGLAAGVEFQETVAAGFTLDFHRRSRTEETVIAETVDENGNVITTSVRHLDTSTNLIPLGVALSLRVPGSRTVTPFVGAGVAYEILINDVHNYEQGVEDTNFYAGPGWQLFGGLLVPLSSEVHLLGEVWANDATVRRNIDRYEQGLPVTERIEVDGFGARVGVEFHFD